MSRLQVLIFIICQLDRVLWPDECGLGSPICWAEAKGVAGIGKASGDGQSGSDKAGQQVPPEVYKALTYAGSLFLLTLSVPLILYGLNKLLNKIEDCFGCGPSSARAKMLRKQQELKGDNAAAPMNSDDTQRNVQEKQPQMRPQLHQNQKLHLQLMHQQPKCYSFSPLQEFDDGQHDNKQHHALPGSIFHQTASPIRANSCAINLSSEIDSASLPMNAGRQPQQHNPGASPSNEAAAATKTLPFSHQQPQPFIISSPCL